MRTSCLVFPALLLAVLLLASVALAASTGAYDLNWWTVDGGGGTSTTGGYALSGTVGQPDAGTLSNGAYSLTGGFWGGASAGGAPNVQHLYLPLISR